MGERKLSLTYRSLRLIGLNYPEDEYGDVSFVKVIGQFFKNIYNDLLISMMDWWILAPVEPRMLRPWLLRRLGAKVGKGVFVGDHVLVDENHADLITVDDHAHITGKIVETSWWHIVKWYSKHVFLLIKYYVCIKWRRLSGIKYFDLYY